MPTTRIVLFLAAPLLPLAPTLADPLSAAQAQALIASTFAELQGQARNAHLPATLPDPIEIQLASGAAGDGGKPRLNIQARELPIGDHSMPYAIIVRGETPPDTGRPLFIATHGGGQSAGQPGPHSWQVNTREFQTQIQLAIGHYPADGIYFVPRMADDRLGRWWHAHNQIAFDQVIDHAILHWGADPDRIYLIGISEGGYGTAILAPFMADRLAAANAMAGGVGLANPPANLRHLAFRSDVGEDDLTFDRRPMAEAFHRELDRLRELHPDAYLNSLNVQPGRGHGIDYRPGVAWIAGHARNPWPSTISWVNQRLDGLRRQRFYWLSLPDAPPGDDILIEASAHRATNTITLQVDALSATNTDNNRTHGLDDVAASDRTPLSGLPINLLLCDALLDLDLPITVHCNGQQLFQGTLSRTPETITNHLALRPDPPATPTTTLRLTTP